MEKVSRIPEECKAPNIVLDFTQVSDLTVDQPLAIMPAELAQKALMFLAEHLKPESFFLIKQDLMESMHGVEDMESLRNMLLLWLQERQLIDNISKGNWDAYKVNKTE